MPRLVCKSWNILLFVDSWDTHLQDMWCMRNQVCALSTRLSRHVKPSWCGHKRISKTTVHEAPSTKRLCLMECGKGHQIWKSLFCKNIFHSSSLATSHSQRMSAVYIIMTGHKLITETNSELHYCWWGWNLSWELDLTRHWDACRLKFLCVCRCWGCYMWWFSKHWRIVWWL